MSVGPEPQTTKQKLSEEFSHGAILNSIEFDDVFFPIDVQLNDPTWAKLQRRLFEPFWIEFRMNARSGVSLPTDNVGIFD